jgi:glutaredoxin
MGSAFPWHQYLDPKNKEFFKEGDYTPPEPFMELVRNPSDQNLKMWFHYIERKNELSARLQARMQEYLAKNGASVPAEGRDVMMKRVAALPKSPPDSKRFVFRMYFDSKCPHCKRMFETLSELQRIGFYVDARQVDSDPKGLQGLPVPAKRAEEAEIKSQKITGVPLLLAGDLKTKTAYRIQGYQTVSQVLGALPKEEN